MCSILLSERSRLPAYWESSARVAIHAITILSATKNLGMIGHAPQVGILERKQALKPEFGWPVQSGDLCFLLKNIRQNQSAGSPNFSHAVHNNGLLVRQKSVRMHRLLELVREPRSALQYTNQSFQAKISIVIP